MHSRYIYIYIYIYIYVYDEKHKYKRMKQKNKENIYTYLPNNSATSRIGQNNTNFKAEYRRFE